MKRLINKGLRLAGFQIVRANTLDALQSDAIRFRKSRPFVENVFGHTMYVDHGDLGLKVSEMSGLAPDADAETSFFARTVRPGQTVLDLGANVGLYTLLFAKLVGPVGRVIAFEPGPKSFQLLVKNIEVNGYKNVTAERIAVMDRSGDVNFCICPTAGSDNRIEGLVDPSLGWETVRVQGTSIDDYVGDMPVDFVKIDIQGSEAPALFGMRRTIERNAGIKVVLEYCPPLVADKAVLFRFIKDVGLSIFSTTGRRLTPDRLMSTSQPPNENIVLRR